MAGFLQRLLGRSTLQVQQTPASGETNVPFKQPTNDEYQTVYAEFCANFCFQPGQNFMRFLNANGVTRLRDWFHPTTPEPEPKAFMRLAVDSMRRGINFWETPGALTMLIKGRPPSEESRQCLSVLAQIVGKPIKLYYHETTDGPLLVMEFEP